MTAVTLSPHQLANLQQQHPGLPGTNRPSRTRTPTTHLSRAASFQHSGHANERPEVLEGSAGRVENRQIKTSDPPGQKVPSEANPQDINRSQINISSRYHAQQGPGASESNSTSENQSQQGSRETMLEFDESRLKKGSGQKKDDSTAAPLKEVLRENIKVEAVPSTGSNDHGRRKQLLRAKSDLGPRGPSPTGVDTSTEEENWELRHGWEDQYNSNEYLSILTSVSKHIHRKLSPGAERKPNTMRASTKLPSHRLSTCITPTNDMKLVGFQKQIHTHCKNGECGIV